MPRLTAIHWKKLECIFMRHGFEFDRQNGDHMAYWKEGCIRPVIIPKYQEVGVDIIQNNMRTAGMPRDEYFRYLNDC